MSVLSFPDVPVESGSWGVQYRSRSFESELTGAMQTSALPGAKWTGQIVVPNLPSPEIRATKAFLNALRGDTGRFYFVPLDLDQLGTRLGSGVVSGAGQTGTQLTTSGWDASQPLLFAAGDYFEANGELKQITQDVASNGSGNASLIFAPPLRKSPPNNAQILHVAPRAIMKLADNNQTRWNLSAAYFAGTSFDIEEAIDV